MKKNKFITCYLSKDEWEVIKEMCKREEEYYEVLCIKYPTSVKFKKFYKVIYHFNHIAIDNIEELARKEERRRKRDKSKQKKD